MQPICITGTGLKMVQSSRAVAGRFCNNEQSGTLILKGL